MAIILFHIPHYNPNTSTVETLRVATDSYISADGDTPANTHYDDRVLDGGIIERHMFGKGRTLGQGEMAAGELVLSNLDGELDDLRDHGFDFRQVEIFRVEDETVALSAATQIATLVVEKAEFSWSKVKLVLRDPMLELDIPAITATFAGTNSGATGYEGTADDLKGKLKPFVMGVAEVVAPPMVNSSSLIFICNHDIDGNPAAVNAIEDVRLDGNGAAVTLDTTVGTSGDTTTLANLAAASIAAGKYATCLAAGALRFNSLTSSNIVTCRVKEGANSAARTPAQIVKRLITDRAGKDAADIVSGSVTALDSDQGNEFGIYVESDAKVSDLCWQVLQGAGAWLVGNALGQYDMGRLEDPTGGSAVREIEEWEITAENGGAIEMIPSGDPDNGLPTWKAVTLARRYWRKFSESELAGAVSLADREALTQEWRTVADSDSAVLTKNPGAAFVQIESMINSLSAAATENTRQLTMRKEDRDHWKIRIKDNNLLQLGDIIQVNTDRFQFGGGKKFVITGYSFNFFSDFVDYYLWG